MKSNKVLKIISKVLFAVEIATIWFFCGASCMAQEVNATVPLSWRITCVAVGISAVVAGGITDGISEAKEKEEEGK